MKAHKICRYASYATALLSFIAAGTALVNIINGYGVQALAAGISCLLWGTVAYLYGKVAR